MCSLVKCCPFCIHMTFSINFKQRGFIHCPSFHHFMENPSQWMCKNPWKCSPEFLKRELYLIFLFVTTLSPSFFASLWWHRSKGRHEGSRKWWIALPRYPFFVDFSKYSQQTPLSWSNNKNNNKKVNLGEKKPYYCILGCYTILKQ